LKSPKSLRILESEKEKKKSQEIKEFPLIQLDDFKIETESTLANKIEKTKNTFFDLHKILENIFNDSFT